MGRTENWTAERTRQDRTQWGESELDRTELNGGESELDRTKHVRVLVPCTSGCSSMPTILCTVLLVTRLVLVLENASLIRRPVAVLVVPGTSVITSNAPQRTLLIRAAYTYIFRIYSDSTCHYHR